MKKYVKTLILVIIFPGCTNTIKVKPYTFINDPIDTAKVRFDGFYNMMDTSMYDGVKAFQKYTSIRPVILSNNKNILADNGGATLGNEPFTCDFYKEKNARFEKLKKHLIGKYTIKGDSLYAFVPTTIILPGMIHRIYNVRYRGFIKNKDTITDWKIISPYPFKIGKFEKKFNPNSKTLEPQVLYFVKTDAVKCLNMK